MTFKQTLLATATLATITAAALPAAAQNSGQSGATGGAAAGAVGGAIVGGPVGAVVGGVAGAVVGGVLTADDQTRVRTYVVEQRRPSVRYEGDIAVGTTLPRTVQYYDIPENVGVRGYRYTVVNDRTVLVDPATGRIVQIIQ